MERLTYKNIYDLIKTNYSNIFGEKNIHVYLPVFLTKCANELMKCSSVQQKILVTPKYQLMDDKAGLYKKEVKDKTCFIVAGGSSLKDFDFNLLKNKTTFVSNKTIFDVPDVDYFITTDYTFLNFLKKVNLYEKWKSLSSEKYFVANCISDFIKNEDGQITDLRYGLKYELQDFDDIIVCKSAKNVGFNFENFNSGYNSGFCSFQLALVMGYKTIYLLGMDMNCDGKDTHYHKGYGKSRDRMQTNLMNYSKHFKEVLEKLKVNRPDLKIISCSPVSSLNEVIPYQDIKDVL